MGGENLRLRQQPEAHPCPTGIHSVSVMLCLCGQYSRYYTLRDNDVVCQEQVIRNIEPVFAYQLELSCLSKHSLEPCLVESDQFHTYHGIASLATINWTTAASSSVLSSALTVLNSWHMNTADYFISGTDHHVTGILDALEVVKHRVLAAVSGFIAS
jgi:Acetyl-CoA carboxylase, central region